MDKDKAVALNYLVQAQQCCLATKLTEEMNKYPKGSPERTLLKSIRLGVAYGATSIHTDYSPEGFADMFKKKEEEHEV